MSILRCIAFLILGAASGYAAKILAVIPTPSISHQVVFRPLTQELARRGHEVVVLTTDPVFPKGAAPENLTEIDLHDISYNIWRGKFLATAKGDTNDLYAQMKTALDLLAIIFEKQIQSDEVKKIFQDKSNNFDLLITEACVRPALAFSHIYKVPLIQMSSLGSVFTNYKTIGGPTHPLLYPNAVRQRLYNLTIWEKLRELYRHYQIELLLERHEEEGNEMLRRNFGPRIPSLSELSDNVHMLFLNIHPIWEGNFPVPPGVVHIGGIHQKPEKELPKDLKTFLDSSEHGVIYMSFGTNVDPTTLPAEKIQVFVKTFSELPYDILWKWNNDVILPGQSKNIKTGKWFPQSDLLRHPKVKLFITQGGLQSTDEAITAGVPLVGIPMLGDQWYNVEKYVIHKIGVRLDLYKLNEENLREAITTVINENSYQKNIKILGILMRDEPAPALQRAVWWVEHVLRHGGARHLRAPAANISWVQYLELELVIILVSVFLLMLCTLIIILYYIIRIVKFNIKIKTE